MCISEFLVESQDFESSFCVQRNPLLSWEEPGARIEATTLKPVPSVQPGLVQTVLAGTLMAHAA